MESVEKAELFERTPIPKAILKMALPTVASSLVMVLYSLADTYFVGMLNDPIQNAAVTFAASVLLAFNAINNLFGIGCSSMMSRALGSKDFDVVRKASAFGFYSSVICGAVISVLYFFFSDGLLKILGTDEITVAATAEYLKWTTLFGAVPAILNVVLSHMVRSEGATMHASVGSMSGCLLNIILDPIFILPWGLNMGAAGAGLATFIANTFACLYYFVLLYVKRKRTYICLNPKMFRINKQIVFGVCIVGIPASIQNLLNVTGMTVLNNFTSSYGADAVAAMGISYKVTMIPMYIAMGLSHGVMPLVSYNYAAKNLKRMKSTVVIAAKITVFFLAAATIIYYISASGLMRLFMDNDKIVNYGTQFIHGMCIASPFLGMDFLAVGVFQATGMGGKALAFAIMRKIILEIPALIILNMIFPLYGLAYAQFAAEFILAIAAVIVLVSMFKKLSKEIGPAL